MLNKIVFLPLLFNISLVNAGHLEASYRQKYIDSQPVLKQLDSEMNKQFIKVTQIRRLKKFIDANQKAWRWEYDFCAGSENNKDPDSFNHCKTLLQSRINFFREIETAHIYSINKHDIFSPGSETYMLSDRNGIKYLHYFGGWMPNGHMDPNTMKGYPYDGYICDGETALRKNGNSYQVVKPSDAGFTEDFNLKYNEKELLVNGHIHCGVRASMGSSTYTRIFIKR